MVHLLIAGRCYSAPLEEPFPMVSFSLTSKFSVYDYNALSMLHGFVPVIIPVTKQACLSRFKIWQVLFVIVRILTVIISVLTLW